MGSTYHLTVSEAPINRPLKILERDELSGQLLGEYVGYRNAYRQVYILYPRYNPYASRNGKLRKHEISDRLVRFPKEV